MGKIKVLHAVVSTPDYVTAVDSDKDIVVILNVPRTAGKDVINTLTAQAVEDTEKELEAIAVTEAQLQLGV